MRGDRKKIQDAQLYTQTFALIPTDMNPNRHDNKIGNLGLRNGMNSKQ